MQSLEAVPVTPTRASPPGTTTSTTSIRVKKEEGPGDDDLGRVQPANHKRTCMGATLTCKRDHVPRKRGPKRGHGRVINELRAQENKQVPSAEPTSGSEYDHHPSSCIDAENYNSTTTSAVASAAPSPPAQLFVPWTAVTSDPRKAPEPKGPFTSDVYQPRIRDYRYLIPKCVDLYYEHMYPIMPLVYMPAIRTIIARDMTCSEKNLIYALSALTSFHMAGKSLAIDGQPPWDEVGRFFLDECVSVRHRYDFLEDTSLFAVISYEAPDIHVGFMKLVSIYVPLDESFVNAWNDGSDPRVSATTYLHLQRLLAQPLDFLRPKKKSPTPPAALFPTMDSPQDDDGDDPDPTSIQKADLMITQQWLRLIVWQSSFRQGLLSTGANDQSFHFSFPLSIARDTASILQSLPSRAVEVHGMGIFEKIFEIGTWCINVMGAYDSGTPNPSRPFGGASDGVAGMDYVGGELSLFGHSGRSGAVLDPLEFFIKTLSSSPNSKTMYADKLLMFAEQTPGGMRTNLSPVMASFGGLTRENSWSTISGTIGEVIKDEADGDVYCDADLRTEPMMMDTDRGMSLSELGMTSGFGRVNSASTDELALNIVTTRSSGHSTLDGGPLSAGLSNAFSDLSTSGDEYSLHAAYANDILPGINMPGLNSMNSTAAWTSSDPDDERKRAQERSSTTNPNAKAERVLGIW
ncbi:hypothetical protein G7054_g5076 [Neopestalotiopsis clavispora]|nr:hypothetical protein G7054_g5076 [Neopestalotiopsis clavispora]